MKRFANLITIFLCVVSVRLAFISNDIISVLSSGYTMFAAGGLVPFVFARLWKKGTSAAAVASMIVGMGVAFANTIGLIQLINGLVCAIPASIVYIIVTLLTQEKSSAIEA